ncbi:MAG: hypothetical protein Q9216_003067 [Gyalolechia sp. 2 TL-2023]
MTKVIVYTGAPLQSSLLWDDHHLSAPVQSCFLTNSQRRPQNQIEPPTNQGPNWRSIPLSRHHLPTGLTQSTHPEFIPFDPAENERTSFLSTSDLSHISNSQEHDATIPPSSSENESTDILSQYYEHSFIAHHDLPSSQVLPPATQPPPNTTITVSSSSSSPPPSTSSTYLYESSTYLDSPTSTNTNINHQQAAFTRFTATKLTNLSCIPAAKYLHSITPQTMTVNLLVGIIALPPPRTITTKKDNRTVQLVEMIVGDETKAGFGVNVWLSPSSPLSRSHSNQCDHHHGYQANKTGPGEERLQAEMADLRPRDIVLMRNVALTSFRGKVYGQSLRRGMTGVELVWRSVTDEGDRRGWFDGDRDARPQQPLEGEALEKIKRVKDWVIDFVGGGSASNRGYRPRDARGGRGNGLRELPQDTQ